MCKLASSSMHRLENLRHCCGVVMRTSFKELTQCPRCLPTHVVLRCEQEVLQACGRSHSLEDARSALRAVADAAPAAWSLDLMAGLPRLTSAQWEASLAEAVAARPDHISVYDLQARRGCAVPRLGCCQSF